MKYEVFIYENDMPRGLIVVDAATEHDAITTVRNLVHVVASMERRGVADSAPIKATLLPSTEASTERAECAALCKRVAQHHRVIGADKDTAYSKRRREHFAESADDCAALIVARGHGSPAPVVFDLAKMEEGAPVDLSGVPNGATVVILGVRPGLRVC